jgi:putative transport protein
MWPNSTKAEHDPTLCEAKHLVEALGFLLGALDLPLSGIGKISLGLSGVLILGKLRRTGGLSWTIPLSANLVLRNLGLTLFLAQVGMSSGPRFASTVSQTGLLMLGPGALVLLALVIPVIVLGMCVFRMPFDQVAGIVAGTCGTPVMTIARILFVNIVPAFLGH